MPRQLNIHLDAEDLLGFMHKMKKDDRPTFSDMPKEKQLEGIKDAWAYIMLKKNGINFDSVNDKAVLNNVAVYLRCFYEVIAGSELSDAEMDDFYSGSLGNFLAETLEASVGSDNATQILHDAYHGQEKRTAEKEHNKHNCEGNHDCH